MSSTNYSSSTSNLELEAPTQQSSVPERNQIEAIERSVPRDLLDGKRITKEHALRTFQYAHLFDESQFPNTVSRDDGDIDQWLEYMRDLQEELFTLGLTHAEKHIVELCKTHQVYVDNEESKTLPNSLGDIALAIGRSDWYRKDVLGNRRFLYTICYGIFRRDKSQWSTRLAAEWLRSKNIKLKTRKDGNSKKRNSKGFVITCLHRKASQTITESIMRAMHSNHGEYICVRLRKRSKSDSNHFNYQEFIVESKTAYLVQPRTVASARKAQKQCIKHFIRSSLNDNVLTPEMMLAMVDDFKEKRNQTARLRDSGGKRRCAHSHVLFILL